MKKVLTVLAATGILGTLNAQITFTNPELTDAEKYSLALFQANGLILNTISYAKSSGKSAEEISAFTGDQFSASWPKENGFTVFAEGTMNNWAIFSVGNKIEIIEQSGDMIKYKTGPVFPDLKISGPMFNVTYDEYLTFFRIIYEKVAEHLGLTYSQSYGEEGLLITISKKK